MEEEKLIRNLSLTKKGKYTAWTNTGMSASKNNIFGFGETVCAASGNPTKIIRTMKTYNGFRRLARISPKGMLIRASVDENGTIVKLFKVEHIDEKTKKIYFNLVATLKNKKWDDPSYVNMYKVGIHSSIRRAKKYYILKSKKQENTLKHK